MIMDENSTLRARIAELEARLKTARWEPPAPGKECAFCGCPKREYVEALEAQAKEDEAAFKRATAFLKPPHLSRPRTDLVLVALEGRLTARKREGE